MKYVDLRSDTVTQPTKEMRAAMYDAEVGDDVYVDDPTVNKLERLAATITGKESALFVPSGTMGNQIAIMCHTKMGDEIIVHNDSHIVKHEAGATARLSGVNYAIIDNPDHRMNRGDILARIRTEDVHHPDTSLICIENPLGADGTVVTIQEMAEIYEVAQDHNIPVHLDGARLFNAATYLNVDVKDITKYTDSVMFCISKGLCAPIGSIICGDEKFIDTARKMRKLLGGGMRQAGILAACGLISLEKMVERLQEDHDNAKYLATQLNEIEGFSVHMDNVQTNMVFCTIHREGFDAEDFKTKLLKQGIKIGGYTGSMIRYLTNNDVNREDIDYVIKVMKETLA